MAWTTGYATVFRLRFWLWPDPRVAGALGDRAEPLAQQGLALEEGRHAHDLDRSSLHNLPGGHLSTFGRGPSESEPT